MLDGLERIGFTRDLPVEPVWPVRDQDFATLPGYRMRIYQLGNNADFHLPIYRMIWQAPGLVVLHDLAFDDFVRGLQTSGDRLGFVAIREALEARELVTLPDAERIRRCVSHGWPRVARRARGIVVHAEFCRRYLEQIGCRTPIFVVPHPPVESAAAIAGAAPTGARLRAAAEARGARTLVVAAGDVNEAKQLDGLLAAVASLPDDVHVAVVGRTRRDLRLRAGGRCCGAGRAGSTSRPTSATSTSWGGCTRPTWSRICAIRTGARSPARWLARCRSGGRRSCRRPAPISTAHPTRWCRWRRGRRMSPSSRPGSPSSRRTRDRRERIGTTARRLMEAQVASEATAHGYAEAIRETIRLVDDPVGPTMRRWADALADLGVGEGDLSDGVGLRYARALESFTHPS